MTNTKIEWCDSTWNPVTGCLHGCKYCYARRIANRFGGYDLNGTITTHSPLTRNELSLPLSVTRRDGKITNSPYPFGFAPTLHKYKLDEYEHKSGRTIFVCSMSDLFGEWVNEDWINSVFEACDKAPQHRYLFLTKNPRRYEELASAGKLPKRENMWYGATLDREGSPMHNLGREYNTFYSIEPLTENMHFGNGCFEEDQWIIIGAETGKRKEKVVPKKEWVDNICNAADYTHTPVFMKDSVIGVVGKENVRQEFPWNRRR